MSASARPRINPWWERLSNHNWAARACISTWRNHKMRSKVSSSAAALAIVAALLLAGDSARSQSAGAKQRGQTAERTATAPHNFARWEKEVAAYEAMDRKSPP